MSCNFYSLLLIAFPAFSSLLLISTIWLFLNSMNAENGPAFLWCQVTSEERTRESARTENASSEKWDAAFFPGSSSWSHDLHAFLMKNYLNITAFIQWFIVFLLFNIYTMHKDLINIRCTIQIKLILIWISANTLIMFMPLLRFSW